MNSNHQPPADDRPQLSLTISLPEIYDALCPDCREAFLALLEAKARGGMLRDGLRRQLEASARPEGPEDRRREHS